MLQRLKGDEPLDHATVRTGIMNVYEVVQNMLVGADVRAASLALEALFPKAEPLTRSRIVEGSRLRLRERHRGLSYADAAGYVTAVELRAVFVTTDKGFKGLPHVRIVAQEPAEKPFRAP